MFDMETATLLEPLAVPDTFVSGLAEVEEIGGGNYRFTFFTRQGRDRVTVAKLIAPLDVIPPALVMAARAIGCEWVARCPMVKKGAH